MHYNQDFRRHAVPVALSVALQPEHIASQSDAEGFYRRYVKRSLDVAVILLCAPIVLPVMLLLVVLVALDGGRPLYRQTRVGRNGRRFTMWKLRTMIPDADQALARYLVTSAAARDEWTRTQKLKNDPRITRVGRFLRRTSLDEVPQLWNVLTGDMSLVGPRPMLPEQQALYPGQAYYSMLPGITGLWQVSARNDSEFADRAFFDSRYAQKMSFKTDISTLYATVRVVTRATGY